MHIALDIGGTAIRIAAVASLVRPTFDRVIVLPNPPDMDVTVTEHKIFDSISRFGDAIKGIGVALPGTLNSSHTITYAVTIPQWTGRPLVRKLGETYGCPVMVDNDNAVAARGEETFGATRASRFLWVGCGTGTGLVLVTRDKEDRILVENLDGDPLVDTLQDECDSRKVEEELNRPANRLTPKHLDRIPELTGLFQSAVPGSPQAAPSPARLRGNVDVGRARLGSQPRGC